ncbi:cilia- and flagella-associated protein HOATZ-like [Lineus longissimus]|uniref:cilia- and flagella-associated protein HOATZ-like n=1 Tax=Lineus longissimus TaxID=88925 RepID=UPI002B4C5827
MATNVAEFGICAERTVFSDSTPEDVAYAKSFWQSIQLHPPIESRLVSGNVKQRMKTVNECSQPPPVDKLEYPPKLVQFLTKAHEEENQIQQAKLQELWNKKQQSQALLEKQRRERIRKEMVSSNKVKGIKRPEPVPLAADSGNEEEDPADCLKQIDEFDREKGIPNIDSDSD